MACNFGLHGQRPTWHSQSLDRLSSLPDRDRERYGHVSVVLEEKEKAEHIKDSYENGNSTISVALIGGRDDFVPFKSVILLEITCEATSLQYEEKPWREGPQMNEERDGLAATRCGNYVYAAGGCNGYIDLDTIERIIVSDLKCGHSTNTTWTTVAARLSEPRWGSAAVSVKDRFVVVIGGHNEENGTLSSVDIIDTKPPTNGAAASEIALDPTNHHQEYAAVVVRPGPNLQRARWWHGACVLGNEQQQIWVTGGQDGKDENKIRLACMEFIGLDFLDTNDNLENDTNLSPASWSLAEDLQLSTGRSRHAFTNVGDRYLVVAGGSDWDGQPLSSVEVVDLLRRAVVTKNLPDLMVPRIASSMVCTANYNYGTSPLLVVLGGTSPLHQGYLESLPCVELSLTTLKHSLGEIDATLRQLVAAAGAAATIAIESPQEQRDADSYETEQKRLGDLLTQRSTVQALCNTVIYLSQEQGGVAAASVAQEMLKRKES
ncbi:hypothetical protein ACA910_014351 [Epithemia clementina (nom. ined.)]